MPRNITASPTIDAYEQERRRSLLDGTASRRSPDEYVQLRWDSRPRRPVTLPKVRGL